MTETKQEHKPYSLLFHPECSLMDKIVSIVSYFMFPLHTLVDASLRESEHDWNYPKTLDRYREKMGKLEDMTHAIECRTWNKNLQSKNNGDYLVGGSVMIPRDDNILIKWGLVSEDDGAKVFNSEVEILIICSSSCIEGDIEFVQTNGKYQENEGFKRFQTCKLEQISFKKSSKKLLWFHGGGMVLGSYKDSSPKLVNDLLHFSRKYTMTSNTENDAVVLMSIEYRLAPEHPFPSPVIDGLSAVSHIFRLCDELHIAGLSAGGNLAAVVGLESYRKFGSRVKSIVPIDPMLDPTTQSLSFQLNSSRYLFNPARWLRWAWATYLGIDIDSKIDFSDGVQHESQINNSHWNKFFQKPLWRLACPFVDVPTVRDDCDAPIIIVASSKADPLRGDAQLLVDKLIKAKHNVSLIEARGIHVMSRLFDKNANDKFMLRGMRPLGIADLDLWILRRTGSYASQEINRRRFKSVIVDGLWKLSTTIITLLVL
eukprot:CAMPEP_0176477804 /NCGR_PEP_ID=MMETSP0200_2-20121128/834_1 /TAXON_ID=947934 /ORGANISM="Chaetoceros sp., Strain GSL56" /LENGTH=483 /DNA_ID=CAMNT_0017873671 /DNA_START=129 /DNA_END=1581 /DNA_ORIENTATION=-